MSVGKNRNYFKIAKEMIKGAKEFIHLVVFKITRYPEFRGASPISWLKRW